MNVGIGGLVVVLLLSGCSGSSAASPVPSGSLAASGMTCVGDQAASTYVLNQNATPPLDVNGATVGVSGIGKDDQGPKATLTVMDGSQPTTNPNLHLGDTLAVGGKQMKVTHICVAESLPSPMAPGTSRGTVGLANA